ncbi:MAG: hypothetical protein LUB60_01130 [Clostridiales bacterium]|nr:hypothetical protein [Clostridiales bacterium]
MNKKTVAAATVVVMIMLISLTVYGLNKKQHAVSVRTIYVQAQEMVLQGRYSEAKSVLEEIEEEEYTDLDISEMIDYCESHVYYESGDIEHAYLRVRKLTLEHESEELQEELGEFQEKIEAEYEVYQEEQAAESVAAQHMRLRSEVVCHMLECRKAGLQILLLAGHQRLFVITTK